MTKRVPLPHARAQFYDGEHKSLGYEDHLGGGRFRIGRATARWVTTYDLDGKPLLWWPVDYRYWDDSVEFIDLPTYATVDDPRYTITPTTI